MPCGGIFPGAPGMTVEQVLKAAEMARKDGNNWTCWVCQENGALHFLEEFDSFIHARCAIKFLAGGLKVNEGLDGADLEAGIVIQHGHEVILDFSLEAPAAKNDPDDNDPNDPWHLGPDQPETVVEVD